MPLVARLDDITNGHHHGEPVVVDTITGSAKSVYANNKLVARITDATTGSPINSGSPTVFAEKLKLARIGDTTECGGTIVTGASNVWSS